MLKFETRPYKASAMAPEEYLPDLSVNRTAARLNSAISDFEGLFINYGYRETSYPYTQQNLYGAKTEQDVRVAVLENEALYAEFLMDYGARLWKLYDKKAQKDVLYTNDVIRFRNLSIRNAWFSGGVEWNCGIIGHNPFTCAPMYCAEVQGKNREEVLRFYAFERVRSIYYQMDFWLEDNRLMVAVHIENPNEEVVPMYWWSNMATPEYPGGRVVAPAHSAYNNSDGIGIKKSPIPIDQGIDVSYPEHIPDTIDYFYDIPADANKFIANVDADGFGLLQFSSSNLKGRKLFSWGHRPGARHWQEMLTDKAGDYIEIQAGLGKTQYECIPMPPKTSWDFLECYTLACVGKQAVQGPYDELVAAVDRQVSSIAPQAEMDCRSAEARKSISLVPGKRVSDGSGYGYLDGVLTGHTPAHLEFVADEQIQPWLSLLEHGTMGACKGFACGAAMEALLEQHQTACDWQVPYQRALVAYDRRDFKTADKLCRYSMVLENNVQNCHLYAYILHQLQDERYAYFARRCLQMAQNSYSVTESIFRLLLAEENYQLLADSFEALDSSLQVLPRLRMYLSMAYLRLGDADRAESLLLENGGLQLADAREGDRFLDVLYKGIRFAKYGEAEKSVCVPMQFDFIVARKEEE